MKDRTGRNSFEYAGWHLRKLEVDEYSRLQWFDCGDTDINEFFLEDAFPHKEELMAESYSFEYDGRPLALISLQNDSIQFDDDENRKRMTFGKSIELPFTKRYHSIPAVKIGRLGIHNSFQNLGIGSALLECCKFMFISDNRTGCRLITVDSYVKQIGFYRKNHFILFPNQVVEERDDHDTVIMYCDLKPYSNI